MSIKEKKLIVFDFDGTLNESKVPVDAEMLELLTELLAKKMVAVISGSGFEFIQRNLPPDAFSPEISKNLLIFSTTGTCFHRYTDHWEQVYRDEMTPEERAKILDAFKKVYQDIHYEDPPEVFGEVIEDRGTQVTFSALGQEAPIDLKKKWRETQDRRPEIIAALKKYLPDFEVKMPGVTSIDITRKGIDKGYGVRQMESHLNIQLAQMVFVGDALYEGGNDYAVVTTGVDSIPVTGPGDTKKLIREWLGGRT